MAVLYDRIFHADAVFDKILEAVPGVDIEKVADTGRIGIGIEQTGAAAVSTQVMGQIDTEAGFADLFCRAGKYNDPCHVIAFNDPDEHSEPGLR